MESGIWVGVMSIVAVTWCTEPRRGWNTPPAPATIATMLPACHGGAALRLFILPLATFRAVGTLSFVGAGRPGVGRCRRLLPFLFLPVRMLYSLSAADNACITCRVPLPNLYFLLHASCSGATSLPFSLHLPPSCLY